MFYWFLAYLDSLVWFWHSIAEIRGVWNVQPREMDATKAHLFSIIVPNFWRECRPTCPLPSHLSFSISVSTIPRTYCIPSHAYATGELVCLPSSVVRPYSTHVWHMCGRGKRLRSSWPMEWGRSDHWPEYPPIDSASVKRTTNKRSCLDGSKLGTCIHAHVDACKGVEKKKEATA